MQKKEFVGLMRENLLLLDWLSGHISSNMNSTGYSKQHLRILILFSIIGKTTLKDFSKHSEVPTSNLCKMLKHLEEDGLILNERDKVDRRNVWYSLTPIGEKTAKDAIKQFENLIAEGFSKLDEKEEARLTDISRTLNEILKKVKNLHMQGE